MLFSHLIQNYTNMKPALLIFGYFLFALGSNLMAQAPSDQIAGTWVNQEGTSHTKIYKESGKYYGKIVWLQEPNDANGKPKTDKNNPKSSLQDRPLMGLVIISDLEYSADTWKNGTMYSPQKGKTLKCEAELNSDGNLVLKVSAGFFSNAVTLHRL